jgi:DNA-binding IclR family transcriptional regulator
MPAGAVDTESSAPARGTLQSVERALRILVAYETEGQEFGVTELAVLLDVHKSTASRLAATLAAHGFLERVGDAFRLGRELGRLGMLALGGRELIDLVRGPMEELAARTGETVTFAVLDGGEAATVAQVDSHYVVGLKNWVGRRTPLHCTSDGKVLLAFAETPAPAPPLEAVTGRTVTDPGELGRELDEARKRGWATAIGEYEEGLNGVAAPVFDSRGRCQGALCVCGPAYRISPHALPELGKRCAEAASRVSAALVWRSDRPESRAVG